MGILTGMIGKYPAEFAGKVFLLLCGYKSFKAIESVDTSDDTQWLTFWMVMSLVQFAEFWTDIIRQYVPYYNEAKVAAIFWLGAMRGANQLYQKAIRPLLKKHEAAIDKASEEVMKKVEEAQK